MTLNGVDLTGLIVGIIGLVLGLLSHLHLFQHNKTLQRIEEQLPAVTPAAATSQVIPDAMAALFHAVMSHTHPTSPATPPGVTVTQTPAPPANPGGTLP